MTRLGGGGGDGIDPPLFFLAKIRTTIFDRPVERFGVVVGQVAASSGNGRGGLRSGCGGPSIDRSSTSTATVADPISDFAFLIFWNLPRASSR
jgi:hypothetical protein